MIAAGHEPNGGVIAAKDEPKRWRSSPLSRWESVLVLLLVGICSVNALGSPYFLDVQNLLDSDYFDYAIASPFPDGPGSKLNRFNAYPQPGRRFVFKVGAGF